MATSPGSTLNSASAEGTTTVDDKLVFQEAICSYASIKRICGKIVEDAAASIPHGQTIVIADLAFLSDLANLRAAYLTLSNMSSSFSTLRQKGQDAVERRMKLRPVLKDMYVASMATAALSLSGLSSAVAPVLETALGVVGLFREDADYKGGSPVVEPLAFAIELASCLKQLMADSALTVYVPMFVALPGSSKAGHLKDLLEQVEGKRAAAWKIVAPLVSDLADVEARLEAAVLAKDQVEIEAVSAELRDLNTHMQPITTVFGRADQRFTDTQNLWAQVDAKSGLTLLARLLRAEAIQALDPMYLHAEVVASGGFTRVAKGFFTNLVGQDGLSISGSAVVRWSLLDGSGALVTGDVVTSSVSQLP